MKKIFSLSIRCFILFFSTVVLTDHGSCQKSFSVRLNFPAQLVSKKILVSYEDGKDESAGTPDSNYTVVLKGNLYARWVTVNVAYPDASRANYFFNNNFCVGEEPAEIFIVADSDRKDPLQHVILKNACLLTDMGVGKLDSFYHEEWTALDALVRNGPFTDSVDSVVNVLGKKVCSKKLQFISQHPHEYFSIWLFRSWVSKDPFVDADTLLAFYRTVFPDSLRDCFDGKEALKRLEARINARNGMKAPDYATKDISGKVMSPAVNRGKFVLLDFWASWCGPCVASMPAIKKIRAAYGRDKLEIISISLDSHREDFEAALKKYEMTWTQVFGGKEIVKAYNVSAIPAMFLIDPQGRIVYDYLQEADEKGKITGDSGFKKLTNMLSAALGPEGSK